MGAIDQILSILLNSKTVPQLPSVNDYLDEDILPYYKNSIGQMVGLSMANLLRNISVSDSYLGTVTTAGSTSTETEIIDFINSAGFTIAPSELKIISLNTLVDGSVFYNSFIYKPNAPGNYGNGDTVVSYSDLFKFNVQLLNSFDDVVVKIDLGNIGSDAIETAINNGNEIELLANVVYVFECIISGTNKKYLYTGAQPIFIGGGNNAVTASNFIDVTDDSGGDYLPTGGYMGTAQHIVDMFVAGFNMGNAIHDANNKPEPIGADEVGYWDSVSESLVQSTFAQMAITFGKLIKEESIKGTSKIALTASGAQTLDFNNYAHGHFNLTADGSLTITDPTLAVGQTVVRSFKVKNNGFAFTIPTRISDEMDDTIDVTKENTITVNYVQLDAGNLDLTVYLHKK